MPDAKHLPVRKHARLERAVYEVRGQPVLVTVCSRDRRPVLTQPPLAEILARSFPAASAKSPARLYVWCVMPDHVHALVAPRSGGRVARWVQAFKSLVTLEARRVGISSPWQRSYHDHVLRREEAIAQAARYVLDNPVRAGLVTRWQDWPHSGSLEWELGAE